jgi:NTE family protein
MNIENLVLEGGGVRAIAFMGALKYLYENNLLKNIKKVIGSSAGSIYATFIASKLPIEEGLKVLESKNLNDLKDITYIPSPFSYMKDAIQVINNFGAFSGDNLFEWLSQLMILFSGKSNITFQEYFEKSGIELVITGTNLNRCKTIYYSYKTTPKMEVRLAMRISTSIPLFFRPIKLENPDKIGESDFYVDGGLLNNYPIWYFDREGEEDNSLEESKFKTIGLKLVSGNEHMKTRTIEYDRQEISNIKDFTQMLIESIFLQLERNTIHPHYYERTIAIDTQHILATDFDIKSQDIAFLLNEGYQRTSEFIEKNKSID